MAGCDTNTKSRDSQYARYFVRIFSISVSSSFAASNLFASASVTPYLRKSTSEPVKSSSERVAPPRHRAGVALDGVEQKGHAAGAHGLDRHVIEIKDLPKQRQLPVHKPMMHGPKEADFPGPSSPRTSGSSSRRRSRRPSTNRTLPMGLAESLDGSTIGSSRLGFST